MEAKCLTQPRKLASDAGFDALTYLLDRMNESGAFDPYVANAFLPYPDVLDETFGFHEVIAQTGRFKVYRAIMQTVANRWQRADVWPALEQLLKQGPMDIYPARIPKAPDFWHPQMWLVR